MNANMTLGAIYKMLLLKLLELFPEKQSDFVYHYTTGDVLKKLIKPPVGIPGDFLCTFYNDLSDQSEFNFGLKFLAATFKKYDFEDFRFPMICCMNEMAGETGENFCPWTMSFSAARDSFRLWTDYTKSTPNGCAIRLSVSEIERDLFDEGKIAGYNFWVVRTFLPCLYENHDGEEKICEAMAFALQDVAQLLVEFFDTVCDDKQFHEENERLARALMAYTMLPLIKKEQYQYEQEWRLIIQPIDLAKVHEILREGNKRQIWSGLFGVDRPLYSFIKEIMISPYGNKEENYDLMQKFVQTSIPDSCKRPNVVLSTADPKAKDMRMQSLSQSIVE